MRRFRRIELLAASLLLGAAPLAPHDVKSLILGRHLVEIGSGRRLNLICAGTGTPTIVFEQGTGSRIRDWEKVAPAAVALTRTCFYDRAGYGFSDPPDHDMSLLRVTDDLHTLLLRAGIRGKLVLVGHSLGGLYATVYANRFVDDVAGLVLVDPAFADQMGYARSDDDVAAFDRLRATQLATLDSCRRLAAAGELSLPAPHDCFLSRPVTTPAEGRYMAAYLGPGFYVATQREFRAGIPQARGTATNTVQARAVERSFGDMPVRVLTAGTFTPFPGLSAAASKAYADNWRAGHVALAKRSTDGTDTVVADAGHFIQYYQPLAVIDAITETVTAARRRSQ